MPLSKYFGGKGKKVMNSMKKEYGPDKGKSVFYATANTQGQTPMKKKKVHDAGPSSGFAARMAAARAAKKGM